MDQNRVGRGRPDGGRWTATSKNETTGSLLGSSGTAVFDDEALGEDSFENRAHREAIAALERKVDRGEPIPDWDAAYDSASDFYLRLFRQRDECARYFEAGHGHRDDAAHLAIWTGEHNGIDGDMVRFEYNTALQRRDGLADGTVEPGAVLGTTEPATDEMLVEAVAANQAKIVFWERALRTEGRSVPLNQNLVAQARARAQKYA